MSYYVLMVDPLTTGFSSKLSVLQPYVKEYSVTLMQQTIVQSLSSLMKETLLRLYCCKVYTMQFISMFAFFVQSRNSN